MVIPKWSFLILFVFTVFSASASDDVITEILKEITQKNAETIFEAQNLMREYLIHLFTNIRYGILHFDGYNTIIENVIKGLQLRNLDPLKIIKDRSFYQYTTERPPFREIAKVIYNMQGCDEANEFSISRWESVLKIIPHLSDQTIPVPNTRLGTLEFSIIDRLDRPLVNFVLMAIDYKYLNVTLPLTQAILSGYRFPLHSADLDILVGNVNGKLGGCPFPFYEIQVDSYQTSSLASYSATLGRILSMVLDRCNFEPQLAYQVNQLLSASKRRNEVPEEETTVESWLLAMSRDDYPEDIIEARNKLILLIQNNSLEVMDANGLVRDMEGRTPTEKVLGLLAKWLALPVENPAAHKVHAIYPHVKLRYLANNGKYFIPETLADVAFLLNSFLTVNNEVNPSLIQQINEIFQSKAIGWEKMLKNFDFSKYSKPRTLVIDILQLLLDSFELPTCYVITVEIFLKNNLAEGCNSKPEKQLQLKAPLTPIIALSHWNLWTSESLSPVKNCTGGNPIKLIDPECLVDIIKSKHHADYIIDLLRFHPAPAEKYPYPTRYAIFKAVLENLKTEKYKDEVSDFVISQAILRLPLNRKANYPPTFSYLCSDEIADLEKKAPPVQSDIKRHNDMALPCKNVIDPNSLLEAVNENYDKTKLRELLFLEPILYEEYKQLGTREQVLKAVVERRKSMKNVTETEMALLQGSSSTTANGQLPPIVVSSCPVESPPAESIVAPCKVSSPDNPRLTHLHKEEVQDEYRAGVITSTDINTYSTDTQNHTVQQPTPSGSSQTRNSQSNTETLNQNYCSIGETLTAIVDSSSLFRAFSPQAPEAKFIRNKIKSYIIPVVPGFNYTTAEVLRDVLDAIKEDNNDPRVAKNVAILKGFVTDEGPGSESPGIIYACLPDNPVPDQGFRVGKCSSSTCSSNESIVSVIDPESLFDALGPYAPNSSYITKTVATYIMPVDPSKNYKKGEVLRSVLQDMLKNGKEELVVKATIASILPDGPSETSPDLVAVCFPKAYLGGSGYSLKAHEICSLHNDTTGEVIAYPTQEIEGDTPAGPSLSVSTFADNLASTQSESAPVAEVQNEPLAPIQPEPVPVAEVQTEPLAPIQPEPVPVAEVQTEPLAPIQSEPVPVAEVQTEPLAPIQSEPVPVAEVQNEPLASTQPEPVPVAEVQNEPLASTQSEPVPVAEVQNEPLASTQSEPVPVAEVQNDPLSIQQSSKENYYDSILNEQLLTSPPGWIAEPTVFAIAQVSSGYDYSPANAIVSQKDLIDTEFSTTVQPLFASYFPVMQETVVTPDHNSIQDYSQISTQQQPKIYYIQSDSAQAPSFASTAYQVEPTKGIFVSSTINTNDGLMPENSKSHVQNSFRTSMSETSPTADYARTSVDVSSQNPLSPSLPTATVSTFPSPFPYKYLNRTSAVSVASGSQDSLPFPFSVMPVWSTISPNDSPTANSLQTPQYPFPPLPVWPTLSSIPPMPPFLSSQEYPVMAVAASLPQTMPPPSLPIPVLPPVAYLPPVEISSPPTPLSTTAPIPTEPVPSSSRETPQTPLPPAIPTVIPSSPSPPPPASSRAPITAVAAALAYNSQETSQSHAYSQTAVEMSSNSPSPPLPPSSPAPAAAVAAVASGSQQTSQSSVPPTILVVTSPSPSISPPPPPSNPAPAAAVVSGSQQMSQSPVPPTIPAVTSPSPSTSPSPPPSNPAPAAAVASGSQQTSQSPVPPTIPAVTSPLPSTSPPPPPSNPAPAAAVASGSQQTSQSPVPPTIPAVTSTLPPSPPLTPTEGASPSSQEVPPLSLFNAPAVESASSGETSQLPSLNSPEPMTSSPGIVQSQLPPLPPVESSLAPPPPPSSTQTPATTQSLPSSQESPLPTSSTAAPVVSTADSQGILSSLAPLPTTQAPLGEAAVAATASLQEPSPFHSLPLETSQPPLPSLSSTQAPAVALPVASQEIPPPADVPAEANTSGLKVTTPLSQFNAPGSTAASSLEETLPPPPPTTDAPTTMTVLNSDEIPPIQQTTNPPDAAPLGIQETAPPPVAPTDVPGTSVSIAEETNQQPLLSLTVTTPSTPVIDSSSSGASSDLGKPYISQGPKENSFQVFSPNPSSSVEKPSANEVNALSAASENSQSDLTTANMEYSDGSVTESSNQIPSVTGDNPNSVQQMSDSESSSQGLAQPGEVPTVSTPEESNTDESFVSPTSLPEQSGGNVSALHRVSSAAASTQEKVPEDVGYVKENVAVGSSTDSQPLPTFKCPDRGGCRSSLKQDAKESPSGGVEDERSKIARPQKRKIKKTRIIYNSNESIKVLVHTNMGNLSEENGVDDMEKSYGSVGGYHREGSVRSAEIPSPEMIEETTEIYYAATENPEVANIVLPKTPAESIGYMHKLENSSFPVYEFLKWPIILRPKIGRTCYDKKNNLLTSPVVIINITSLFEVLNETDASELDEYLTATHLTSLDTYYKLFDFAFENSGDKEDFLKNILGYLLSFEKRPEIREPMRRIMNKVPESTSTPLRLGLLCNERIYKELPRYRNSSYGITFTYITSKPCPSGFLLYSIRASTDAEPPPLLVRSLDKFAEVASQENLLEDVDWKKIKTQKDLADVLIKSLKETDAIPEETKKYISDYLKKEMVTEKWKMKPVVEMGCKEI